MEKKKSSEKSSAIMNSYNYAKYDKKAMLSNRYYKNGRQKHDLEEFRKMLN